MLMVLIISQSTEIQNFFTYFSIFLCLPKYTVFFCLNLQYTKWKYEYNLSLCVVRQDKRKHGGKPFQRWDTVYESIGNPSY